MAHSKSGIRTSFLLSIFILGFSLLAGRPAHADVTYLYNGSPFTICYGFSTGNCPQYSITGVVDLSSPLIANDPNTQIVAPTYFSFTDNDPNHPAMTAQTDNGSFYFYVYNTNASGMPTLWAIFINANSNDCTSGFEINSYSTTPYDCSAGTYNGDTWEGASNAPGIWSVAPEPPSVVLFGSGLFGLAAYLRRRFVA